MKKFMTLIFALICVSGLLGCASETKSFQITGTEKLTVFSGTTGTCIDIKDLNDIKYITDNINALRYSKGEKVDSSDWSYSLQWVDKEGEIIENLALMGDGCTIIYDGYYYKSMDADYEIDLSFLDSLFIE